IERLAAEYIEKIDAMGGMLAAIEAGYPQREIERAAYDYQKAVEAGEEVVVGVNRFQIKEETAIPILKIDPAFERAQVERVRKARAERDAAAAGAALNEVERAGRSGENLMPRIMAGVEEYATWGEVGDAMRGVFGEYSEAI